MKNSAAGMGNFRNSLVQQGVFVIVFPLLCQILVVALLVGNVSQIREEQLKSAHARDMIGLAYGLVLDTIGGIYEMHADSEQEGLLDLESSKKQGARLEREVQTLKEMATEPSEKRNALAVESSARGLLECLSWVALEQAKGIHNWKRVDQRCYQAVTDGSKNFIESLQDMADLEEPLASAQKNGVNQNHITWLLCAALFNIVLALGLGLFYISRITNALKTVDRNRILLAERKPLLPLIDAHDELMQLDLAIHSAQASLNAALEAGNRMIQEAGNLICTLDNDLLFLGANPAAFKILGLDAEGVIGKSVREFVDGYAINRLREAQNSQEEDKFELRIKRADGSEIHSHWSVNVGNTPGILFCVIQDISEQKRKEGLRQRFLDAVRSSLRTPMAGIVESIQQVIASDKIAPSEEKVRGDLQRASRSARQCILLIDVLLDAQSAEKGTIKIEPERISIGQVVSESIELVRNIAEKNKIKLESNLIDTVVSCDPFKLTQTTINFLSNAIKFSPAGGTIYITVSQTEDAIEVSVTDEGPGISEEFRDKVFKPFVQVPGEKAKEGTGLGLAICKQIVDGHGGRIGVKPSDRSARGSTFWYRIPKK